MLYLDEGYIYERFFVSDKYFNELKVAFMFTESAVYILS